MASEPIPEYHEIEKVYGLDAAAAAAQRYHQLASAFEKKFGQPPELYTRAPGRVNLIGEHIDYEGYGVLPMALQQDTIIAIRRGGDDLTIANLEADKYDTIHFSTDPAQKVDTEHHTWANYFLAAYKGVFEHLSSKGAQPPAPVGLQVMIHGTVPLGSGLSSSAAIVCSSALAILGVYGITLTKGEVSDFTCKSERYVGVTSGGMDQAISVMGRHGVAKMVEFNPIKATDVALPPGSCFVVGHSLAVSLKQEGADKKYNLRVVECRLAAAALAKGLGLSTSDATAINTLKEVEPLIINKYGPGIDAQTQAVKEHLHEGTYSQDEIETLLGVRMESMFQGNPSALRVIGKVKDDGYKLRDRALHVYSEAARVWEFKAVAESDASADQKMQQLGCLMDASHASCAGLYECSAPELDELVKVAKEEGAVGSRLTGAGWGGCTVSLVHEAAVPEFLAALKDKFYNKRIQHGIIQESELPQYLFASRPASGAAVLKLQLPREPAETAAGHVSSQQPVEATA